MNWELRLRKRARKTLARFPKQDQRQISIALRTLSINPYAGDIEKIGGEKNTWRRRIGSYRILYEVYPKEKFIHIVQIRRRGSKTY